MTDWTKQHKTLSSKQAFNKGFFTIYEDVLRLPDGTETTYLRRENSPFSVIIPILGDKIIMVRQYRHGVNKDSLEFPMGKVDGAEGEQAARIELKQETGYTAGSMTYIGSGIVGPSNSNLKLYAYVAEDLTEGDQELEDSEFITIETHSESDIQKLIDSETIFDIATIASFYFFGRYKHKFNI